MDKINYICQQNINYFKDPNKTIKANYLFHLKMFTFENFNIVEDSYSSRYYTICELGSGNQGTVTMIKDRKNGKIYAQKEIKKVCYEQALNIANCLSNNKDIDIDDRNLNDNSNLIFLFKLAMQIKFLKIHN